MARKFTLYWSNLAMYEDCPQKFLWSRGWGDIDLGNGPGRRKPVPIEKSEHHAFLGTVIQAVLERMYNDELWKHPGLVQRLEEQINKEFKLGLSRFKIDWRLAPPLDEMQQLVTDGVMGFLKTFKHNKLVGPYARSEVETLAYIDKYNPIGGRMDFLIRRDDVGIMILDGKNGKRWMNPKTKKRELHIDPDQLRFYALAFFLEKKVMPDKLGFVLYRYPWGYVPPEEEWPKDELGIPVKPEPETGMIWVDFTKQDLEGLAHRAVEARRGMEKHRFDPVPEPSKCKFCDYETVCPARQEQKAANRRTPKNKPESILAGATGFVQFGMSDGQGTTSKG